MREMTMAAAMAGEGERFVNQLAASDIRCPACGQSMRGTTNGRCSECGTVVTLEGIAAAARRNSGMASVAWFVAAAAAGLHLVTSMDHWRQLGWGYMQYGNGLTSSPATHAMMKVASEVFWMMMPLVFLFLIGAKDWFSRRPKRVQWIAAIALVALAIVTHRRWIMRWV